MFVVWRTLLVNIAGPLFETCNRNENSSGNERYGKDDRCLQHIVLSSNVRRCQAMLGTVRHCQALLGIVRQR